MSLRDQFERIDKALERVVPKQAQGQERNQAMANWRDSMPSNRFKASDFEQPRLLTIDFSKVEDVGDDRKPVLHFKGEEKTLVLNITNGNSVEEAAGTADMDRWGGVEVVLYKTQTDYQGKRVDCIRVRAPKPQPNRQSRTSPPPPPRDEYVPDDTDVPFGLIVAPLVGLLLSGLSLLA